MKKFISISFLLILSFSGCASYRSTILNRGNNDLFARDKEIPYKGVPVAVKVPTHLDVSINETFFLKPIGADGAFEEVYLKSATGIPVKNLSVEHSMVKTKKIFFVDIKRAASGISSNTMTFNEDQYIASVKGKIEDKTLKDVTSAIGNLPSIFGKKQSKDSETTKALFKAGEIVRQTRVVAFRRFDLDAPDFERQVEEFVNYHLNDCNQCAGQNIVASEEIVAPSATNLPGSGSK